MEIRSWMDAWNAILREVIFPDEELKKLMMIPDGTNIITFIDKYFIRDGFTNDLLENEDVRIVYGDIASSDTEVPNVKKNEMSFDIYVRKEHMRDATNDRLQLRTILISDRLIKLLTKNGTSGKYLGGYRFWVKNDLDLGTKTTGYSRYNVTFYYMKVY